MTEKIREVRSARDQPGFLFDSKNAFISAIWFILNEVRLRLFLANFRSKSLDDLVDFAFGWPDGVWDADDGRLTYGKERYEQGEIAKSVKCNLNFKF